MRIVIAGRANVGKSTLFNRLAGKRLAIVDDTPGVTRDPREAPARLLDLTFTVVDTAGFEDAEDGSLEGRMWAHMAPVMEDADAYLFVMDARAGVTALDEVLAEQTRRRGKPVVLVANKAEGRLGDLASLEAYSLGLGDPVAISAEHGEGMADLRDAVAELMGDARRSERPETAERPLSIAILGRPNVGKSTLLNQVVGEAKSLTGPEPGLTRDAVTVTFERGGRTFKLIDTAGLRRRSRIHEALERASTQSTTHALRFAEAVIVVIDATQPFEKQDLTILELVAREGRALVIAFNKWDLVEEPDPTIRAAREAASRLVPQASGVRVIPVSALSGRGVDKLMASVVEAVEKWSTRISTGQLNRWLQRAVMRHPPPAVAGRRIRIRYVTQAKSRPPTFVAFCSRPDALPAAYQRYLVNSIREEFELPGVPLRLILRKGDNPYAD